MGIKFGMWSTILLLGSGHGIAMAWLLLRAPRNQVANRFLAALLLAVVLRITPYTIGYAGFYDAYPWLNFAPLDWRLAFGPLLYFYVRRRFEAELPKRWAWHFAPAALLGSYYLIIFCRPLEWKNAWDEQWHVPWLVPLEMWAGQLSLLTYWLASYLRYRGWQRWLEQHSAAREEYRLAFLHGFLLALAATAVVQLGFDVVTTAGVRVTYFDRFPLYLTFTALVYYLGLAGWRHADQLVPSLVASEPPAHQPAPSEPPAHQPAPSDPPAHQPAPSDPAARPDEDQLELGTAPGPPSAADAGAAPVSVELPAEERAAGLERDWAAVGQHWAERMAAAQWWREPELSLTELARRLGTNTRYLSRAFNEGLGVTFSELINLRRVEAAKLRLSQDGEILAIALEVGFASKASFNRVFKAVAGCTPSAYRAKVRERG